LIDAVEGWHWPFEHFLDDPANVTTPLMDFGPPQSYVRFYLTLTVSMLNKEILKSNWRPGSTTSENFSVAMPRMISHGVESGVAGGQPLADGVDFSTDQLRVRVSRHEPIHQRIQQREKAPSHGKYRLPDVAQPEDRIDVAKVNLGGIVQHFL
jgi:hypothetical protein